MTKEYNSLTLDDVIERKLAVKSPRKYDDSYICKTFLVGSYKIYITVDSAELVSCKQPGKGVINIYLKLDSRTRRKILALESKLTDICKDNIEDWFDSRHKLNSDMVDEYFHSNIVMDKRHGMVFKTRLYTPDSDVPYLDLPLQTNYKIVMRLVGIRFQKQSVSLVWDIPAMTEIPVLEPDSDEGASITSSDRESIEMEDVDEVDPLVEAVSALKFRIEKIKEGKQLQINELTKCVSELASLQEKQFENLDEVAEAQSRVESIA